LRKIKSFFKAMLLGVCLALVGLIGLTVYLKNGLPIRSYSLFTETVSNFQDFEAPIERNKNCLVLLSSLGFDTKKIEEEGIYCLANSQKNDFDVLILGDSHSLALYHGFSAYYGKKFRYLELGTGGWPVTTIPFADSVRGAEQCKESIKLILKVLSRIKAKKVLVVTRNFCYYKGWDIDNCWWYPLPCLRKKTNKCSNSFYYINSLREMLKKLRMHFREVYFLYENPVLDFNPVTLSIKLKIPIPLFSKRIKRIPGVSYKEFREREHNVRKDLSLLFKETGVTAINTDEVFCEEGICWAIKNGKTLYRDDDHLGVYGASLVAAFLERILFLENPKESKQANVWLN
jgi:hypothetical protein